MDFTALKSSLAGRGFQRFTDQLLGEIVNDACAELDEMESWPYREASVTGTAPVAITDLGEVDQVFDVAGPVSVPLEKRSYRELVNDFGDVSLAGGCPWFWYRATPAGVPTVATYPVSSRSVGVQYWRSSPVLAAGSDEPLSPERFHSVVVLIGERMAYARQGDAAVVVTLQGEIDRKVLLMRAALLMDDAAVNQVITGASCDW